MRTDGLNVPGAPDPVSHNEFPADDNVSPLGSSPDDIAGGGHFPDVPTVMTELRGLDPSAPSDLHVPAHNNPVVSSPSDFYGQHSSRQPLPVNAYQPRPAPVQSYSMNAQLNTDDVAIAKAQKHARFAISALNFEDAVTAVKELRAALQTLGAE